MQIEEIYQLFKKYPRVVIDNRQAEPGTIFFGIKGDRFDGNSFAESALQNGAEVAIIDNEKFYQGDKTILVDNSLSCLQQLANYHRRQFQIPFLAIGGSNGKTTTKELTFEVLNSSFKTFATKGNFNNHIGVPLTLLSVPTDTEIAIIEIGANHLKETYELCQIAMPNLGVVTNNGKDHLEGFGSEQNVRKANAEMFAWLKEGGGKAFVNSGHQDLKEDSNGIERLLFGSGDNSNMLLPYECQEEATNASIRLIDSGVEIRSQLFGSFNCDNLATAAAVGRYFNIPDQKIKECIESYAPGINRSQVISRNNVVYYVDCYNANPSSMELSLKSFVKSSSQKRAVILGDMLELGAHSETEHHRIIDLLKSLNLDKVILIGSEFGKFTNELECEHYPDTAEMISVFDPNTYDGWSILLKGSRRFALEKILEKI